MVANSKRLVVFAARTDRSSCDALARNRVLTCCAVVAALLTVSEPTLAHHGQVAYERKSITLTGSVTKYEWSNPHTVITLAVKDDKANVKEWYLEILSPVQMLRAGWTRESVKPGDEVTVTGLPGKHGVQIMWLEYLVTPDGQRLSRDKGTP